MPAWLGEEPVGVKMSSAAGGVHHALPELLTALGKQLPADPEAAAKPNGVAVAELLLKLADPTLDRSEGKERAAAVATLIYVPTDGTDAVESDPYPFVAPIGPIEAEDGIWSGTAAGPAACSRNALATSSGNSPDGADCFTTPWRRRPLDRCWKRGKPTRMCPADLAAAWTKSRLPAPRSSSGKRGKPPRCCWGCRGN